MGSGVVHRCFYRHISKPICFVYKEYVSVAGSPVTTCYNQATCYWLLCTVYCVIETKASLLYCLSTVHNVYHLSIALSVTRYHNMAVNEADLIASQILKEFVIS